MTGSRIRGVGAYRPARVVHNDEICGPIDSTDEWIRQRSGIVSRRFAGPDDTVVSMATRAADGALRHAGVTAESIDVVIVATMSYLYQSPAAGPQVADLLGARRAAAFDLGAACAGFCAALAVADGLVRSGSADRVLVVGSERMTDIIDPKDRSTAFLFADGAGAVVVESSGSTGIHQVVWGADGGRSGVIGHEGSWARTRDDPGFWPVMRMAGPEVFRWAISEVAPVAGEAVRAAGLTVDDLAAFVPHQANVRIIDRIAGSLGLPASVVVSRDVEHSGNTSAASIPLAMETLVSAGRVPSGGLALLSGFGAGLTHASLVARLP
ncbi:beta-ketoacyl-ACP synthase III [Micromonospora sp. WMMD980]|uniref:beta-ketoacyl-ACP synthase III n=1 Tax=Micromonospora sp. WMMD980 TaxID=3016088 RepID=UPI002415F4A9|nr:beta-ketoacyl-ACP synthase III [Micromonospora sp. WMMD980]MDG4801387.1 ketoacyl-ACP synthase III [Micromonospora sp. WMMD980]